MQGDCNKEIFNDLPQSVQDFIKLIIKKMRYRKKVRLDVQRELAAHFEDELCDFTDSQQREQKAKELIEQFGNAKILGILMRRAKKRCRPLWRAAIARTFQTAGIVIICFILYCIYISLGRPNVKIDYIKKMTELVRPAADERQNAAQLYVQAIALYKQPPLIEIEDDPNLWSPYFGFVRGHDNNDVNATLFYADAALPDFPVPVPNDVNIKPHPSTKDLLSVIDEKKWIAKLTEIERTKLEEWIQGNSEAIDLYVQAGKKPYCWWERQSDRESDNLMSLILPELKPIRDLSKLVGWRSKVKAEQGDIEGAFEDIFAIYRTGEHFKGPRTLIEQLVGVAIEAIAINSAFQIIEENELDEQKLLYILNEFKLLVYNSNFKADFKSEQFFFLDFIQRCYTDNGRGSGHMTPIGLQQYFDETDFGGPFDSSYFFALGASVISASRAQLTEMVEDIYEVVIERSQFTPWQRRQMNLDAELNIDQWSRFKQIRYWPVVILLPAVSKVSEIFYRIGTDSEALITVISLQIYKRRNGHYPKTLDLLVKSGLIDKLPNDPFSDNNLVYKLTEDGFILYSLGLNFEDNGGQVFRDEEGKVKLWADEGDVVFWPVQK